MYQVIFLSLTKRLTKTPPYPLPRDRGPGESRRPVAARHAGRSPPVAVQDTHDWSGAGAEQQRHGCMRSRSCLHFAHCSMPCRRQSWAHIQIQKKKKKNLPACTADALFLLTASRQVSSLTFFDIYREDEKQNWRAVVAVTSLVKHSYPPRPTSTSLTVILLYKTHQAPLQGDTEPCNCKLRRV